MAIVRRPASGHRERLERTPLTVEDGIPGNRWGSRTPPSPEAQIAVVCAGVARLIAGDGGYEPFGDNLFVDLDLSEDNLPAGSRLAIGTAVLEVTAKPHTGCRKYLERFGPAALELVSDPSRRGAPVSGPAPAP